MNFAEFVKSVRLEKGLTQEEMAFELTISTPWYNQIEKGKKFPSLDECERIANMYGYKIEVVKK